MCESLAKRLEMEKSDAESAALCYMCAANGKWKSVVDVNMDEDEEVYRKACL